MCLGFHPQHQTKQSPERAVASSEASCERSNWSSSKSIREKEKPGIKPGEAILSEDVNLYIKKQTNKTKKTKNQKTSTLAFIKMAISFENKLYTYDLQ